MSERLTAADIIEALEQRYLRLPVATVADVHKRVKIAALIARMRRQPDIVEQAIAEVYGPLADGQTRLAPVPGVQAHV